MAKIIPKLTIIGIEAVIENLLRKFNNPIRTELSIIYEIYINVILDALTNILNSGLSMRPGEIILSKRGIFISTIIMIGTTIKHEISKIVFASCIRSYFLPSPSIEFRVGINAELNVSPENDL